MVYQFLDDPDLREHYAIPWRQENLVEVVETDIEINVDEEGMFYTRFRPAKPYFADSDIDEFVENFEELDDAFYQVSTGEPYKEVKQELKDAVGQKTWRQRALSSTKSVVDKIYEIYDF